LLTKLTDNRVVLVIRHTTTSIYEISCQAGWQHKNNNFLLTDYIIANY
jgi:hypothetical protein